MTGPEGTRKYMVLKWKMSKEAGRNRSGNSFVRVRDAWDEDLALPRLTRLLIVLKRGQLIRAPSRRWSEQITETSFDSDSIQTGNWIGSPLLSSRNV